MRPSHVKAAVAYWQRKLEPLGLRHWEIDIKVVDKPDSKDSSDACMSASIQYDTGHLQVSRRFLADADDKELDQLVVHELLHLIFRDHDELVRLVTQELGETARALIENRLDHEIEGVIERLARTIVALHSR